MIAFLAPFTSILVHPGKSHLDEILATALAIANLGRAVPVYRRDPTDDDLQNQEVLVLDQGGRVDNWANVFDHHQRGRDEAAECTFTLLAKEMGVDSDLGAFFPWYRTWAEIDAHGPFAWAKMNGLDWNKASALLNPLDDLIHEWWEEDHGEGQVDPALVSRLLRVGRKVLSAAKRFREFCDEVHAKGLKMDFDGLTVYDLRQFDANESLDNGDKLAKADGISGGVLVSRDNRGPGDSYYRREDDPHVNFAKCGDKPYAAFAHVGGFILKTKEPGTDIQSVIRDAKV